MLKKEKLDLVRNDLIKILIIFLLSIIILKIVFYREGIKVILKISASLFWLYIIPGFSLVYYWHEKFSFFERFVIGAGLGFGIIGIISYYFGLVGFHVRYHGILPIILILVGMIILYFNNKK